MLPFHPRCFHPPGGAHGCCLGLGSWPVRFRRVPRELQDKALKFFSITGQTMESFVRSLDGDVQELDSDENQFVFALAGIVTSK